MGWVSTVIGNPRAFAQNRRYLDRDLNRSFQGALLESDDRTEWEIIRARELLHFYGPAGVQPCQVAIDLHSTTAAMGNCLVVYGRRPADLALAALIQAELDYRFISMNWIPRKQVFLLSVALRLIEVGPVPQSVLDSRIVRQTRLALETCFRALAAAMPSRAVPTTLVVHRHLGGVDRRAMAATGRRGCRPDSGRDWQCVQPSTHVPKGRARLPRGLQEEPSRFCE